MIDRQNITQKLISAKTLYLFGIWFWWQKKKNTPLSAQLNIRYLHLLSNFAKECYRFINNRVLRYFAWQSYMWLKQFAVYP